jgi:hypothetical protein
MFVLLAILDNNNANDTILRMFVLFAILNNNNANDTIFDLFFKVFREKR